MPSNVSKVREYNRSFLLAELRKSLDKAHDITCSPNAIHYQFVLSRDGIWETSDMP
jgi:hypothetical protein